MPSPLGKAPAKRIRSLHPFEAHAMFASLAPFRNRAPNVPSISTMLVPLPFVPILRKFLVLFLFSVLMQAQASETRSLNQAELPEIRIGYIEASFSPSERKAFAHTFLYLSATLPQYRFTIRPYLVKDLETAVRTKSIDFFLAASGFYRRLNYRGLRDLATLVTPTTASPDLAVGTVFLVKKESPYQTFEDLQGLRAAANWEEGFTGVYVPMGEAAARGYDPDDYWTFIEAGSPVRRLLLAVQRGDADVAMARACTIEELRKTEPELVDAFRPVALKNTPGFPCLHSTALYPNWTFVSNDTVRWETARDITAALLTMPSTPEGARWGVTSNFNSVDDLYRQIRRGPFEYLRITSVKSFLERYWPFCALVLMAAVGLVFHSRRADHLVKKRTEELRVAMDKENEMTRRLETLERVSVIGAMSSLITHELNGPLNSIANSTRALERFAENNDDAPPVVRRTLALISLQCSRASEIVSRVRQYVKRREPESSLIEINPILQRIVSQQSAVSANARITGTIPSEPVVLQWNPLEAELCVTNLVKNAVEATKHTPGAKITVSLTLEKGKAAVVVTDNAQTTSESLAKHGAPLSSSKESGLGLGLLIVKTLTERAMGHFSLERKENLTEARITLPLPHPSETSRKENADHDPQN